MTPGPLQILLVLLVILLLFGASRVPGIAENLAKGIKSFKKGLKDDDDKPDQISDKRDEGR
jgi:sec-independent protein translocase protein TatA